MTSCFRKRIGWLLVPCLLMGCDADDAVVEGDRGADTSGPAGIELIRSSLTREAAGASASELEQFGRDSRDFTFDLYAQAAAAADRGANLVFSSYSLRAALGMLYAGAEGETETEMAGALRFTLPEPALHSAFNATDVALTGRSDELVQGAGPTSGDLVLRVVNGLFGAKGLAFKQPFLDTLALHYGTGVYAADFAGQPERERAAINDWVAGVTEDRIRDLVPPREITADTLFVLVNAIYFKGSWLSPFDAAETRQETFHAPGGDVTVAMMNGSAERYAEGEGYQALELKYVAPDVRMLFVLPAEGQLEAFEGSLDRARFDELRGALAHYDVTLKLPKFSFEHRVAVKPALEALGMQAAFGPSADLSGVAGAPGEIMVSNVLHKAFIAVDEQGTEAAAATAVIGGTTSAPPPAEFFADRPFLFFIYDEPTGQVLFCGRVMDPS